MVNQAQLTYEKLIAEMNHQMLVTDGNRVAILQDLLAALDHPDHAYQIIHIAGTNGKGSTGAMLNAILQKNGYHVGRFSSPAMLDDREQIQLDGHLISYDQFLAAYHLISQTVTAKVAKTPLSIFEWFTLIALVAFKQANVDFVILEVGLGGKNDATNAIDAPLLSVITHIDYDHTQILGKTIRKIATQKAGIIKSGAAVIVAPAQKRVTRQVLRQTAKVNHTPIHFVRELHVKILEETPRGTTVTLSGPLIPAQTIHLRLLGTFQIANLATVLSTVTWLQQHHVNLATANVHAALAEIQIPGRMQVLQRQPTVFLDGAHNPDGAKQLAQTLRTLYPHQKFVFLLGFLADKNYFEMLQIYLPLAKAVYVNTPSQHARALTQAQLKAVILRDCHFPKDRVFAEPTSADNLTSAKQKATANDVIVITGSFYFIKQFEGELHV
ncbi:bifunctional folylpolyglutamate synthase/dihydrofolate synthase [Pediococcus siamensis]|uniref:bifunctional folylpolyglutamate synthase/dihydrofolate synthase n=1 Tax=Pediococcus siamensis TaxID=381829 RepID=UPI0039A32220